LDAGYLMLHVLRLLGATRLTRLPWRKRRHQETEANERLLETGGARLLENGGYRLLENQP
jgi:hypothetical protein